MDTGHEVAMALRAAYWALHRQADACFQPFDVTANQFVLLALLDEEDGVTQRELVERASSDANTVGAMLAVLEDKGLVTRMPHPDDGRARRVTLTRTGRLAYRRLWAKSEAFRDRLLGALRPGEPEALLDLLGRLAATLNPRRPQVVNRRQVRGKSPIPLIPGG
jgi:DNA-binding MarR family transcriptional regulator